MAVSSGKITKDTTRYQQLMVVSTAPAIAGNWPGENESNHELIAFLGQVKTRILGPVNKGDFIIPSGKNDGTGIAVSEQDLTDEQLTQVVGQSWESSSEVALKMIHTAVGFNFASVSSQSQAKLVKDLEATMATLHEKQDSIEALLKTVMANQNSNVDDQVSTK